MANRLRILMIAGLAALGFQLMVAQTAPRKDTLPAYESTIRPSSFDDDLKDVKKANPPRTPVDPSLLADSAQFVVENMQGFRVQVYIANTASEALTVKQTAAMQFVPDSVYVVYDPPVYKVRIGDYLTREGAERKLTLILQAGYPDAWIVPDRVLRRIKK